MTIGLTGGIGSGKSVVGRLFEVMGCLVVSSDVLAKQSYFKLNIRPQIIKLLGEEAYINEHTLNKTYISAKIFANKNLLEQVNGIIHPEVKKEFALFVKMHPNKIIIKESALLFETGLNKALDKIIVVAANDELRIKRVMQRDHLLHEQVVQKIKMQIPQEEKIKQADFVIYNNEDALVTEQVLAILNRIKGNV